MSLAAILALCAVLPAASQAESNDTPPPFGVFVEETPFVPIDPWCGTDLTGFRIETPFGSIQSLPSQHRVEWINEAGTRILLSRAVTIDELPLSRPTGLAWDGEYLWIADTGNRRILKARFEGAEIDADTIDAIKHEQFRKPVGLAFNPRASELYVSDTWSDRIFVIEEGVIGRTISMHGSRPGFVSGPMGILYNSGLIYVADSRNSRIQIFTADDGSHHSEWGLHVIRPHESAGHLHYPTDMRFARGGELIVVDEPWESRQQTFRRANPEETVPERLPIGADDFVHYGSGVDSHDRLFAITDPDTHTVRVFDLTLETPVLIGVIGRRGSAPHEFIDPFSVAFLPPSDAEPLRLVVADRGNARLAMYTLDWSPDEPLRFRPDLASLHRTVDLQRLRMQDTDDRLLSQIDPVSLCMTRDGAVAVLDDANGAVVRFDPRLRPIDATRLPRAPEGSPTMWSKIRSVPSGGLICVNSAHRLLVVLPPNSSALRQPPQQIDVSDWATEPTDIHFTPDRSWIVDRSGHRLIEIDSNFKPILYRGTSGLGAGEFHHPVSITRVEGDRILVIDRGNHRIQIFDDLWKLETVAGPRLYIADADLGGQPLRTDIESQK